MTAMVVPFRRPGGGAGRRRGGRRHDDRPRPRRSAPLPAVVRAGERRPLPGARSRRDRRRAQPRRGRRHARRPQASRRPRRAAHADGARDGRARAGDMRVCVLSGGVGGARFVRGLAEVLPPADVTVVGNVGDDLEVLGLHVSPDLDSVLYALAGLNDEERGWGRADETWNALDTVSALGGETWFRLGDRDIGLHLVRTEALRAGGPLSAVTAPPAAR